MALPAEIGEFIDRQARSAPGAYADLRVVVFNGTTKRSPEPSNTDGLLGIARGSSQGLGLAATRCAPWTTRSRPGFGRTCASMAMRLTTFRRSTARLSRPPTSS